MIKVLHPGLYCSLQDGGRYGFRKYGVPLSGYMDRFSAELANSLVGNKKGTVLFEFTNPGPIFHFSKATKIALTGASFEYLLNGEAIEMNSPIEVAAESTLQCGRASDGVWGYVSVQGGLISERVMGSQSYYSGITQVSRISKGDSFNLMSSDEVMDSGSEKIADLKKMKSTKKIQVFKGPEFELLSEIARNTLFESMFSVSPQSNRMAYLLEHSLELTAPEILTAPVQPGTVQLTPSGKVVVLMRDAQTTGGYARILQLSELAINLLSQKRAGSSVRFSWR